MVATSKELWWLHSWCRRGPEALWASHTFRREAVDWEKEALVVWRSVQHELSMAAELEYGPEWYRSEQYLEWVLQPFEQGYWDAPHNTPEDTWSILQEMLHERSVHE